jgi:hypothetical protein
VVNFVYLTLDSAPTIDSVKDILNLVGLVSALILGASLSTAGQFSLEDWEAANLRCAPEKDNPDVMYYPYDSLSDYYNEMVAKANSLFFSSVITVVIVYMSLVSLETPPDGTLPQRSLAKWYFYARAPIIWSILCMIVGLIEYSGIISAIQAITMPTAEGNECITGANFFSANKYQAAIWKSWNIFLFLFPIVPVVAILGRSSAFADIETYKHQQGIVHLTRRERAKTIAATALLPTEPAGTETEELQAV